MSKNEKNIDKLSFIEILRLKTGNSEDVMNIFEEKARKPVSSIDYTPEDIEEKLHHEIPHSLTAEQYEAELNEATTTLSQGATEISDKLNSLAGPEIAEIIVEGEKEKNTSSILKSNSNNEKENKKDEDEMEI